MNKEKVAEYILLIALVTLVTGMVVFFIRGLIMCPLLTLSITGITLAFSAVVWALFQVTTDWEEGPGPK